MTQNILAAIYPFVKEMPDSPFSIPLIADSCEYSETEVRDAFKELRASGLLKRKHYFSHVYILTETGYQAAEKAFEKKVTQELESAPPINLLLGEDDPDDAFIFELALKKVPKKFELRQAADGNQLFVELQKLIPDLLFLDINMPCKDGISCIIEIRKDSTYENMPVIMLTGSDRPDHIEKAFTNGANYYIIKPASVKKLSEKLMHVFDTTANNVMYYPAKKDFVLN